jgi:hypothetical protein
MGKGGINMPSGKFMNMITQNAINGRDVEALTNLEMLEIIKTMIISATDALPQDAGFIEIIRQGLAKDQR